MKKTNNAAVVAAAPAGIRNNNQIRTTLVNPEINHSEDLEMELPLHLNLGDGRELHLDFKMKYTSSTTSSVAALEKCQEINERSCKLIGKCLEKLIEKGIKYAPQITSTIFEVREQAFRNATAQEQLIEERDLAELNRRTRFTEALKDHDLRINRAEHEFQMRMDEMYGSQSGVQVQDLKERMEKSKTRKHRNRSNKVKHLCKDTAMNFRDKDFD